MLEDEEEGDNPDHANHAMPAMRFMMDAFQSLKAQEALAHISGGGGNGPSRRREMERPHPWTPWKQ